MNPIKIGVIGAGVLGGYHLNKCVNNPSVDCIGFYDSSQQRAEEVEKSCGLKAFDSIDSLIDSADAVIIAVPCSAHLETGLAALRAGKHVLLEKPLADSYDNGEKLVEAAERQNCILHVGHSEIFNPAFERLVAFSPAPRFMEIHRLAEFSPRGTDVSVILDLMVHDLHLVYRLCKEEPDYGAIAATGVPVISPDIDIANVRLSFPSGLVVNCTASRVSIKRMRKLRLFQKNTYFSVDLDTRKFERCYLDPAYSADQLPVVCDTEKPAAGDALEKELDAFVNAINGEENGNRGGTTGNEALIVLKITDAIMKKIQIS
ncbi:MAG: gfo/Idh/MocA family oxidoreductase [Chitinivibrionales bacterium]|nr:gfo/Idh/MocA family oxidoreductase [Chitinivibrionales bacterium]